MPVSATAKATTESAVARARSANWMSGGASATVSVTDPPSVNLNAFESRFLSTCWRRCSSVSISSSTPGCSSIAKRRPRSSATGRNDRST